MIASFSNTPISSSSCSPNHAISPPFVVSSAYPKSIPSYKQSCSRFMATNTKAERSISS
jgi:hypothetical protein